ncbi:MAG TPA: aminoacyl-tRNA hydrolase [Spirochaetota bacterium]|nr:aminoacyl-tRNA hydrolase [Spirochaetota bacterium]HNT12505.1 aminoacyl-tRNA hydrolase [Spirochaetota bacterium]HNV49008.1 aminoacyl-tRNA hydrolase [Spirochaetota bacterium]HPI23973.1 aminoacyl-tRNA hydrolase [Spirochaetota bacterium]HPU88584.1 aminoacyl-tRNA hydrolase [Spirochaetota bacterium]
MFIIACLGNPGSAYGRNRHNVGFLAGEYLARTNGIRLDKKSFSSITGKGRFAGSDVLIMLPQTYMNASGDAVQAAMSFYRLGGESLVVLHDEVELPFGEVRVKFGGGHKGHNGVRSIIQQTGSADFHRIRIGVGRPPREGMSVADHALSNFSAEELAALEGRYPAIAAMVDDVLNSAS